MDSIVKELKRVQSNVPLTGCDALLDDLLLKLEAAKEEVNGGHQAGAEVMERLGREIAASEKKILAVEKDAYSSLSKFGKALERTFKSNSTDDRKHYPITGGSEALNKAIMMHLARTGEFDVASIFMNEAELKVPKNLLQDFARMYEILQYIISRDLDPAIKWATDQGATLKSRGSNLEFVLHKVQFMRYLKEQRDVKKALAYARANFPMFGSRYLADIEKLSTSILYVERERSPYDDLLSSPSLEQLAEMFASEFCSLLGLPPESPLYLAVTAGSIAMPVLSKMETLMKSRGAEWTTKDELAVDAELPDRFSFHAIFVCPVSKEQTTSANPPMMLPCGHILARESLRTLGISQGDSFKCPYCPLDTTYAHAKPVFF